MTNSWSRGYLSAPAVTVASEWHHHYLNLNSTAFPLSDPATTQSVIESNWFHLCCVCINRYTHLPSLSQILFLSVLNKPPNWSPTSQIRLKHCWPGSLMSSTIVPALLDGDNEETRHLWYARHSYKVFIHANSIYPNHIPLSSVLIWPSTQRRQLRHRG